MADDALLSDLCSICNTNKSKYRCPGCAARTCSLPCYKRHQQWAQCTGKRDPTKYVKKSQLATPAGIDHDFNYLTSVERELERADRHVEGRDSGNASALQKKGRNITDRHFADAGVTVIRAPKGLSRQKVNKTHPGKKGHIVWTVEWIREDMTRTLTQSSSGLPLLQAQPFKGSEEQINSRKRRRAAEAAEKQRLALEADQDASIPILASNQASRGDAEDEERKPATPGRSNPGQDDVEASAIQHGIKVDASDHASPHVNVAESEPVPQLYSFYLLRPRTSSSRQVLIPLDLDATLADCLRGHTVLEFPTIYAFSVPSQPPPEDFILEREYLVEEGEQQKEFEDLIKDMNPRTLRALKASDDDNNASEEIDSKAILDVLKQDLGAGV
ncbi:hypothetical protein K458DRAFT_438734 [Lentithecium fluviatile CBS 122367]|uniref:Box C/D snoRNA protein 1 n=1 Tax=Lentithecium fluviatile CBS 122367 TaxID=1168545 RepID=A0A6G1JKE6_9PLEO|nr:hypothetical protein K458DRAFT_438734 [Lentithecium fluviatile CBS 122367]